MANQRGEKAKLQSQTEYPRYETRPYSKSWNEFGKKKTHTHTHTQTPQINKRYKSYLTSIYIIILLKPYQII